MITVTATEETVPGYATIYPSGGTRPTASVLNFVKTTDVANLVVAPVGANGKIKVFNGSTGASHLVVDVAGYINGATVVVN